MFDLFYFYRVIWRHKAAVDFRNIFDVTPDKYYIKSISFSIASSTIVYVNKFRFETRCPKVRNQCCLSIIYYVRSSCSDYAEISVTIIYVFTFSIIYIIGFTYIKVLDCVISTNSLYVFDDGFNLFFHFTKDIEFISTIGSPVSLVVILASPLIDLIRHSMSLFPISDLISALP